MKFYKFIILLPLFCIMLCVCAGMGHIFYQPDSGGLFAEFQECTAAASGTLKDPTAGYIRSVRSSSFMAANNVNSVAERTPVQYLRTGQISGTQNGYWCSLKKRHMQKTTGNGGVKAFIFGTSGLVVPYHKTVSVLNCGHFSKCYILALGRLLC